MPTPGEIEHACELIREADIEATRNSLGGRDKRKLFRQPKEVAMPKHHKETFGETQLCDCPYWGTEFNADY